MNARYYGNLEPRMDWRTSGRTRRAVGHVGGGKGFPASEEIGSPIPENIYQIRNYATRLCFRAPLVPHHSAHFRFTFFFWFSHPLPFSPHLPPLMHHPTKTVVVLGASYAGKFNNSCHVSVSTKVKPPFVMYRTQSSSPARRKNSRGLEGCCY